MASRHFYTARTCRQRQLLDAATRDKLDTVVLGLGLVPTLGVYTPASDTWSANVGSRLRVVYRILSEPTTQIVIVYIGPLARSAEPVLERDLLLLD